MKELTKIKLKNKIKQDLYEICDIYKKTTGSHPTVNIICEGLQIGSVLTNDKEITDSTLSILTNVLFEGGLGRYQPRDPSFGREEGGGARDPLRREKEYDPAFKFEGSTRLSREMQDMVNRGLGAEEAKINFEDFLNTASDAELVAWAKRNTERQQEIAKQQEIVSKEPEVEPVQPETMPKTPEIKSPEIKQTEPLETPPETTFAEPETSLQDIFSQWLQSTMNQLAKREQEVAQETNAATRQEIDALTQKAAEKASQEVSRTEPISSKDTRAVDMAQEIPQVSPKTNVKPASEVEQKTSIEQAQETKTDISRPPETKTNISSIPPIIPFVPVDKSSIPDPRRSPQSMEDPNRGRGAIGGGGSGGRETPATSKTDKADSGLETPSPKLGDVRYPALRATADRGVLPIYEGVHKPQKPQASSKKRNKYKIVMVGEGGKKKELSAGSLSGIKRLVYGQKNFKVYNSQGTDITGHFNVSKKGKK